jgi:hypothetical protein
MKQTNQKIWRISSVLTLILTLFVSISHAQAPLPTFSQGTLTAFPLNNQLYPRILPVSIYPNGYANVSISGSMNQGTFNGVRVRVYRDNNGSAPGGYGEIPGSPFNQVINTNTSSASFNIVIQLPSELFNYRFDLHGFNGGTESAVLVSGSEVVAGDAFIIQGQSNALAERRADGNANSEPNSQFIRSYGSPDERGYSFSPSQWGLADGNGNFRANFAIGMWGMRLASQLTQNENIPIAIVNGGYGSDIIYFMKNFIQPPQNYGTPQNPNFLPNDGSNNYLRLQKRVNDAGLANNIRGIFWWQGESDILNPTNKNTYISRFLNIHSSWISDFDNIEKFFIVQVRIGCYTNPAAPPINGALDIFQAQLEIFRANSDFEIFSTQNLEHIYEVPPNAPSPGWYCHFGYNLGYRKAADLFLPTVRQTLYGISENYNEKTPFPVAADITSPAGNVPTQITVELNDLTGSYSIIPLSGNNIRDYFRIEGGSYPITDIVIQGGVLRINFTNSNGTTPTAVSYFGRQQASAPVIENAGGHSLVGFSIPIVTGSLPIDPLSLTVSRNGSANTLRWRAESNERFDQFVIEKGETRNSFKSVQEIYGTGQDGTHQYDFTDNKPNATVTHYRIRAIQMDGKEVFSQVVTVNNRLNNVKEFRVYPNPVVGSANATINMIEAAMATINLHDASGRLLSSRKLQLQKGNNQFSVGELLDYNPGTYIVRVVTATETQQIRVVKAK